VVNATSANAASIKITANAVFRLPRPSVKAADSTSAADAARTP
jgi:hypothetical protein